MVKYFMCVVLAMLTGCGSGLTPEQIAEKDRKINTLTGQNATLNEEARQLRAQTEALKSDLALRATPEAGLVEQVKAERQRSAEALADMEKRHTANIEALNTQHNTLLNAEKQRAEADKVRLQAESKNLSTKLDETSVIEALKPLQDKLKSLDGILTAQQASITGLSSQIQALQVKDQAQDTWITTINTNYAKMDLGAKALSGGKCGCNK